MFNGHTHTMYSNVTAGLDCINKLPDLIAGAKKLGLSGLAITNHDNLSEVVDINAWQKKLRADGDPFTLAIGNEIYLIDEFDPESKEKIYYYHAILIAKDKIGYQVLIELSTKAWYRAAMQNRRRRIPTLKSDVEEVMRNLNAKGHIAFQTACLGGELPKAILDGDYEKANKFIEWGQRVFGNGDFYIEIQPSTSVEQKSFNSIAERLYRGKVPFVVATDAHYLNKEDYPIFEAFMRSQQEAREVKEYYEYARLMSEDEARSLLSLSNSAELIQEAIDNTEKIRKQIEFYDLSQKFHIPKVKVEYKPWSGADVSAYPTLDWAVKSTDPQTNSCIVQCLTSLEERGLWNDKYLSRLEEEFDVFKFQSEELNDNFFAYFVTMKYYLDMSWSVGCAVGPSRGSASGSLLCYLMDIVQGDPIKSGLYFWRFANKVRASVLNISGT